MKRQGEQSRDLTCWLNLINNLNGSFYQDTPGRCKMFVPMTQLFSSGFMGHRTFICCGLCLLKGRIYKGRWDSVPDDKDLKWLQFWVKLMNSGLSRPQKTQMGGYTQKNTRLSMRFPSKLHFTRQFYEYLHPTVEQSEPAKVKNGLYTKLSSGKSCVCEESDFLTSRHTSRHIWPCNVGEIL